MMAESSELTISRFINAAPAKVWRAWSRPEHLAQWWIPHPIECEVVKLDLQPGGGFETRMREGGGAFQPHVEGRRELLPRRGTARQPADDRTPGRVGERVEGGIERHRMDFHLVNHA